jgi:hypothetical protein
VKHRVSENKVNCLKIMYECKNVSNADRFSNTFCHTNKCVRHGLIFKPYVFNMFTNIIGHTSRGNTHAPSTEGTTMPFFLFTKDLETPFYTSNGKVKETNERRN